MPERREGVPAGARGGGAQEAGTAPAATAKPDSPAASAATSAPAATATSDSSGAPTAPGVPPPLRPFGLRLHYDGRWSHEGRPILHRRLREHFDRSVRYLPEERKYVVTLRHFRGEIEVEEAGFFVREVDLPGGTIVLSDRSRERLDPGTLCISPRGGALLCRVKRELAPPQGLLARFVPSAHAELLQAVVEDGQGVHWLPLAGRRVELPGLA